MILARSGCLTIVVVQHSTQPRAALDGCSAISDKLFLDDEPLVQTLVVALVMVVQHKFVDGLPHGAFAEQNDSFQARLLDGSHKALRVGIVECQQLQAVLVNPPIDSASAIRFFPWRGMSMRWTAGTSVGERTVFFTTGRADD